MLDGALSSALPFAPAENALDAALVTAKNDGEIDKAVKQALASGARPGCPAIDAAEKFKASMAKAGKDGKRAPKYKPVNPPTGGATPGWADQGQGRKIAVIHDNSV